MAIITFQRPVQMSSYPVTIASTGGGSFSTTQIAANGDNVTANFFGNFTNDVQTLNWVGTVTRVVIGTNDFLDLDITNFSLTTSGHIPNFVYDGIGNFLPILLAGNDTFIGTTGADGFIGYDGSDTASYANAAAGIVADLDAGGFSGEAAGDSYVAIENLTGSQFADFLVGNAENNTINGGGGADTMQGKGGNDLYNVNIVGDQVIEANGEGTDHVISTVSYSLIGQYIEVLTLSGTVNINGTGNGQSNTIRGNAGNNIINGAGGADTMAGKGGNDRYGVENVNDKVIEASGAGTDHVLSSVSFSLAGQFVEQLTLTGTGNINATGNSLANLLTGNAGNNILNGATGNDNLTGGGGIDFFRFNTALGSNNVDSVTDFQVNVDKIQLDNAIFTAIGVSLTADEFVANANGAAANGSQHILYDTTDGRLFYDADGIGGQAKVHFATLNAGLALDHLDFVVI